MTSEGNVVKSGHRVGEVLVSLGFSDGLDLRSNPAGLTFVICSVCSENGCTRVGLRKKRNL